MQTEQMQTEPGLYTSDYYTMTGLARRWGVDISTISRRHKRGQLPPSIDEGLHIWSHEGVVRWEQERSSIHWQMLTLADDMQNRMKEIVEAAEKRGTGFTRQERCTIARLLSELDEFTTYARSLTGRTELSGANKNDVA